MNVIIANQPQTADRRLRIGHTCIGRPVVGTARTIKIFYSDQGVRHYYYCVLLLLWYSQRGQPCFFAVFTTVLLFNTMYKKYT